MDEASDLGDWKKLAILGSGAFGVVSLWRHKTTSEYVAIKKCRWDQPANISKKQRERWTQEVEFMKRVKHPNIVLYKKLPADFHAQLDRFNLSRLPLLPMEYCSGGNLRRLLNQPENACGLREVDVRCVLNDLTQAVSYLHRLQITHRDIKPENVVIVQAGDKKLFKLIDLGYAKDMDLLISYVGTLGYTAPEIFMNKDYTFNVDYWSFGIVAYEICCGKHPFLPKLSPVQRFELIAKKRPRDICVYQSQSNKIIYTDKILEPNHVSSCFRTHLEDWLSTMLQYKSEERGKTQDGVNVFSALMRHLNTLMVHVFSIYNYAHYYYEIHSSTTLGDLKRFIRGDSGLHPNDQLLIVTSKSHYERITKNPNALLSELNLFSSSNVTLNVFKRYEFVRPDKVMLPLAVRNLLHTNNQQWDQLYVQTSQAVHYIEHETNNMNALKCAVYEFYEYLKMLMVGIGQDEVMLRMRSAAQRTLNLVEFCNEMNAVCTYDCRKQDTIKRYRKHLWRARELIENVNAATVRWHKTKTRDRILKLSFDKISNWLDEYAFDKIYDDAVLCMNINKQKSVITAKEIAVVICKCLRTRKEIQHDAQITQHIGLCFKVLREYDKLPRWMKALTSELKQASVDLLDTQKNLIAIDMDNIDVPQQQNGCIELERVADLEDGNVPSFDDLIKDNRMLRYNMQEVLSGLLVKHKKHAVEMEAFVKYVNDLESTKSFI